MSSTQPRPGGSPGLTRCGTVPGGTTEPGVTTCSDPSSARRTRWSAVLWTGCGTWIISLPRFVTRMIRPTRSFSANRSRARRASMSRFGVVIRPASAKCPNPGASGGTCRRTRLRRASNPSGSDRTPDPRWRGSPRCEPIRVAAATPPTYSTAPATTCSGPRRRTVSWAARVTSTWRPASPRSAALPSGEQRSR